MVSSWDIILWVYDTPSMTKWVLNNVGIVWTNNWLLCIVCIFKYELGD